MGRKLKALEWERLISEQRRSGEKIGVFCERHGLARSTFSVKKKELSQRDGGISHGAFRELCSLSLPSSSITVRLPHCSIEVPSHSSVAVLRTVLAAVKEEGR
jgi:hypothetical protein